MAAEDIQSCFVDDPDHLREWSGCLYAVSQTLDGGFTYEPLGAHECRDRGCTTRPFTATTPEPLRLAAWSCDGTGDELLGTFAIRQLVAVVDGTVGTERGVHSGRFVWTTNAGHVIEGVMTGITNAGTHHGPHLREYDMCREFGHLEGQLCGRAVDHPTFGHCQLFGMYAMQYTIDDASHGHIGGAIEGAVACDC